MSYKVKRCMFLDSIVVAINVIISLVLFNLCSNISYDVIEIASKAIIITASTIINIVILFFFLLYWWSDIKWTQCKQKARRFKQRFLQ